MLPRADQFLYSQSYQKKMKQNYSKLKNKNSLKIYFGKFQLDPKEKSTIMRLRTHTTQANIQPVHDSAVDSRPLIDAFPICLKR